VVGARSPAIGGPGPTDLNVGQLAVVEQQRELVIVDGASGTEYEIGDGSGLVRHLVERHQSVAGLSVAPQAEGPDRRVPTSEVTVELQAGTGDPLTSVAVPPETAVDIPISARSIGGKLEADGDVVVTWTTASEEGFAGDAGDPLAPG